MKNTFLVYLRVVFSLYKLVFCQYVINERYEFENSENEHTPGIGGLGMAPFAHLPIPLQYVTAVSGATRGSRDLFPLCIFNTSVQIGLCLFSVSVPCLLKENRVRKTRSYMMVIADVLVDCYRKKNQLWSINNQRNAIVDSS